MRKSIIVVTTMDKLIAKLAQKSEHKTLGIWAADCAQRVLPYFEEKYPEDNRPRKAIEALRTWVQTGIFKMADVRGASLASHAAARSAQEYSAARSVARAAGQAMATAHVPIHSIAAGLYAATAVRDATDSMDSVIKEREWQYQHLVELRNE